MLNSEWAAPMESLHLILLSSKVFRKCNSQSRVQVKPTTSLIIRMLIWRLRKSLEHNPYRNVRICSGEIVGLVAKFWMICNVFNYRQLAYNCKPYTYVILRPALTRQNVCSSTYTNEKYRKKLRALFFFLAKCAKRDPQKTSIQIVLWALEVKLSRSGFFDESYKNSWRRDAK